MSYLSPDIETCRAQNHHFEIVGSDKTPMKRSLMCRTCTDNNPGKSAYVAYGDETKSWGQWRRVKPKEVEIETEVEEMEQNTVER